MFFKKKPKPEAASEDAADTPAPAVEGGDGEGDGAPVKKKLPIILIAAVAGVFILGGGGAGAWFFLLKPKPEAAAGEHGAKPKKKKKDKGGEHGGKPDKDAGVVREGPEGVTFYTPPDLVVNIQAADGRPTFLKLKLTYEMKDHETAEAIEAEAPRLKDMYTSFLRELRPEDLSGSQGSYQLRMEVLRRVNLVLAPHHIDAVLIEEMLIQ